MQKLMIIGIQKGIHRVFVIVFILVKKWYVFFIYTYTRIKTILL